MQGSITYTYDNASRRTSMTVAGQPTVNYTYDNANRLTQITQGTATVTIGYDNANRRTSLTLPNGIAAVYGYDPASRVTSITYTQGQTTIGNLTYTYDANGRRTSMGGSLARSLDPWLSSATGRFHRGISLALLVLAGLIAGIELWRHDHGSERWVLCAVASIVCLVLVCYCHDLAGHGGSCTSPGDCPEP